MTTDKLLAKIAVAYVDPDQSNDAAWLTQAQAASRPPYPSRDALAHHLRVALNRLAYRTEHERVTVAAYAEAVVNLRAAQDADAVIAQRIERLTLDDNRTIWRAWGDGYWKARPDGENAAYAQAMAQWREALRSVLFSGSREPAK